MTSVTWATSGCSGPSDLDEVLALLARDPVVNVVADYRTRLTQLQPRWLGGEMWG